MGKYTHYFKSHWYGILRVSIIILAIFLRFYNYENRWGLAYDQAHDALIAKYAVDHGELPLLGPFSSAGPYQTGGEWYWIVMAGTAIFPYALITPWLFMTSLYVLFVYLIMLVGKKIADEKFSLIVGLFAAISTAQVAQGTNLTNQSPLALVALLGIWSCVLHIKSGSLRYLFFLGFCIGLASSIHLSGMALIFLALSLFIVYRKVTFRGLSLLLFGAIIPWIPVFIVDLQNNLTNIKNMLQYYLHDQHTIPLEALGRRWLTYLGVFWPTEWAHIIGGFPLMGYLQLGLLIFLFTAKKRLTKEIVMIMLSIVFMIILLRYTHTPIFKSYLVFMHPFILLLTSWLVYRIVQRKKSVGLVLLLVICIVTLSKDYLEMKTSTNHSNIMARQQVNALKNKYGDKKFAVYTYKDKWKEKNYILTLYLTHENRLDPNGLKIGTVVATQEAEFKSPKIWGENLGYKLIDISGSSSSSLKKHGWKFIDAKTTYRETEEWYR